MDCQKDLFQLPEDIHYLNCGYMAPLLKSVEEAGLMGMQRKRDPSVITANDFFNEAATLRRLFAQLVNCKAEQVAIIPSASYGLQNAVNNIPAGKGKFAITVADEFPSDYYAIKSWCDKNNKVLKIIDSGNDTSNRGKHWNEKILNSINGETAAVILSSIHWQDGTLFDLKAIGKRCKEVNTVFIVDGTQSVGARAMDVTNCNIDALVCASYKWLLGPYSIGAAFYSEQFNNGIPVEESWMNRTEANEFSKLTDYSASYMPGAGRYNVGEYSNFILTPMFIKSIEQIVTWQVENIQAYCKKITSPLFEFLGQKGMLATEKNYRSDHLFGIKLPAQIKLSELLTELQRRKIFVSVRGNSIRVTPNVYNDNNDIDALRDALEKIL